MTFSHVKAVVGSTPHMTPDKAEQIRKHITRTGARDVLELGFRHGVSTCYLADHLRDVGGGHVTTIDLAAVRHETPNIEDLLTELDLRDLVTVWYEPTSYTWRLMKMLAEDPTPRFDLCYLDGAHNWFVDGFAFFLVDRLLRSGGWIVFDDVTWTYATSPALRDSPLVKEMPADERDIPQVKLIVDLLVRPHPDYGKVRLDGDWAFVQKLPTSQDGQRQNRYAKPSNHWMVQFDTAVNRVRTRIRSTLRSR